MHLFTLLVLSRQHVSAIQPISPYNPSGLACIAFAKASTLKLCCGCRCLMNVITLRTTILSSTDSSQISSKAICRCCWATVYTVMISFGPLHNIVGSTSCNICMLPWLCTYCKQTNSICIGNVMQIIMCISMGCFPYADHAVQVLGLTATPAVDFSPVSSTQSFWPCCFTTAEWRA